MTTLAKSRKSKKKTKARLRSPETLFNEALERYQRFKTKNDKFEHEMLALIERVSPQIEPFETAKYQNLHAFTHQLIPFFSKKSLPDYLRNELFDCICGNLDALSNNPYSHHLQIDDLETAFDKHRGQHLTHHHEKQFKKLTKDGVDPQEIEQLRQLHERVKHAKTPEELEQLLKESLKDILEDNEEEDFEADLFGSLFEDDAEIDPEDDEFSFDEPGSGQHDALNHLFKQSSICVFRTMLNTHSVRC